MSLVYISKIISVKVMDLLDNRIATADVSYKVVVSKAKVCVMCVIREKRLLDCK